jgi:hypothetical protein
MVGGRGRTKLSPAAMHPQRLDFPSDTRDSNRIPQGATESTEWAIFHNAPFLQHLPETLSKVDLGFLKGLAPPMNSIPLVVNKAR